MITTRLKGFPNVIVIVFQKLVKSFKANFSVALSCKVKERRGDIS